MGKQIPIFDFINNGIIPGTNKVHLLANEVRNIFDINTNRNEKPIKMPKEN